MHTVRSAIAGWDHEFGSTPNKLDCILSQGFPCEPIHSKKNPLESFVCEMLNLSHAWFPHPFYKRLNPCNQHEKNENYRSFEQPSISHHSLRQKTKYCPCMLRCLLIYSRWWRSVLWWVVVLSWVDLSVPKDKFFRRIPPSLKGRSISDVRNVILVCF